MFPGIYDFRWDAGHLIFLGIFYSVLTVVMVTMAIAVRRALRDFRQQRAESLRWHADFDDLPSSARRCRHELAGEVPSRTCPNGFDCRHCQEHPRLVAAREGRTPPLGEPRVAGFELPADRLYHRGHTWVKPCDDGTVTIGLDDLGRHLMGKASGFRLPPAGSRIRTNGTGWESRPRGVKVRILSPIDGEVVAHGGPDDDWVLKVIPEGDQSDMRHLLTPAEAKPWMLREVERFHIALASDRVGAALADGGVPVEDLSAVIPRDRLDDVYGMVFMNP